LKPGYLKHHSVESHYASDCSGVCSGAVAASDQGARLRYAAL
jgi:hypothetical protein